MNHFVVDASIWVARLVPQDEHHNKVKNWIENQLREGTTLVSPSFLLVEIAGAISRRTGDPDLAQQAWSQVSVLPSIHLVEMNQELILEAARMAASYGFRGADSIYVAVAALLKIPLITLDVDQRERAKKIIIVEMV